MESLRKYAFWVGIIVSQTALICILLSSTKGLAIENGWTSSNQLYVKIGAPFTGSSLHKNVPCMDTTFHLLEFKGTDYTPTKVPKDVCAVKGGIAQIGAGYIRPVGGVYGYKIDSIGNGSSFTTAPNAQNFIRFNNVAGSDISKNIYVHKNIRSAGDFVNINSNLYKGVVYQYRNNDNVSPLKLSDGTPIGIKEYSFSNNGKWMVAEWVREGLVRIELETGEMTLFSHRSFTYNYGITEAMSLAISNDGNTVISSSIGGLGSSPIYAYDLSGCEAGRPFKTFSKNITGCKEKIVTDTVKTSVPGSYVSLTTMQFSNDGRRVDGVLRTQEAGTINPYRATLSLDTIDDEQKGYIALGDSFASGEGDMDDSWYEEGTNTKGQNLCHLSKRSYPYLIREHLELNNFNSFACSGAKQHHLLNVSQYSNSSDETFLKNLIPGLQAQLLLVKDAGFNPDFITISIGGNDLGFSEKLKECIFTIETCHYANNPDSKKKVAMEIASQLMPLRDTYSNIIEKTDGRTKIYVIGYPQFIDHADTSRCGVNVRLDAEERRFIHESVQYANDVIEEASKSAGVYYVDIENTLAGRNLCTDTPKDAMTVNGLTRGDDVSIPWYVIAGANAVLPSKMVIKGDVGIGNESYHPNQNGHELMKQAILSELDGDPVNYPVCADVSKKVCGFLKPVYPSPGAYFTRAASDYISTLNGFAPLRLESVPRKEEFLRQTSKPNSLYLDLTRLSSSSTVTAEIHSTPTPLGEFTTDANGELTQEITIPDTVAPGYHTVHVYGTNLSNEPIHYYESIYLTGEEGDLNGNSIPDDQEDCGFVPDSEIDYDRDGIDDACDSLISEPPDEPEEVESEETPQPPSVVNEDKKSQSYGETVAGNEEISPITTPAVAVTSTNTPTRTIRTAGEDSSSPEIVPPTTPPHEPARVLGSDANNGVTSSVATTAGIKSVRSKSGALYTVGTLVILGFGFVFWRSYQIKRSI